MPIIRSGYVTAADRQARQTFYNSGIWKKTRAAVRARDRRCRFCGRDDVPLEVAHEDKTLDMILAGAALDPSKLFAGADRSHCL
jgi:hypothetical protein